MPFRVSLVFLLCAAVLYGWAKLVYTRHKWRAVEVPVSFARDAPRTFTATFRADKTTRYWVGVECDRTDGDMNEDENRLRKSVAGCRVTDAGGKRIDEPQNGGSYGEKISYNMATFDAADRETYTVSLDTVPPGDPEIDRRNPHLIVEITPIDHKQAYVNAGLLYHAASFCAVVSVVSLLVGLAGLLLQQGK